MVGTELRLESAIVAAEVCVRHRANHRPGECETLGTPALKISGFWATKIAGKVTLLVWLQGCNHLIRYGFVYSAIVG